MENIGERVRARRIQLGLTQAELAQRVSRAGFEIGQSAISTIETKGATMPLSLYELAEGLQTTVDWLRTGKELPPLPESISSSRAMHEEAAELDSIARRYVSAILDVAGIKLSYLRRASSSAPILPLDVPKLPVGSTGRHLFGSPLRDDAEPDDLITGWLVPEIAGYAPRTPYLSKSWSVFALSCPGYDMVPWRGAGELMYVDPESTPHPGMHVVLVLNDADDPKRSDRHLPIIVGRLERLRPEAIELAFYNPPRSFQVPRATARYIWKVVEWTRLISIPDEPEE